MKNVRSSDLLWTAGVFDGDGCIWAGTSGAVVMSVSQAEKGWAMLRRLHLLWGGSLRLNLRKRKAHHQRMGTWTVAGPKAKAVCLCLAPVAFIKGKQLEFAVRFPVRTGPCIAITATSIDGTVVSGKSKIELARKLGIPVGSIYAFVQSGIGGGYTFEVQEVQTVTSHDQDKARKALQDMKKIPHGTIPLPMPAAYVAGFLEADGCFSYKRGYPLLSAAQKFPAIIDALQQQYGGCKHKSPGHAWMWALSGQKVLAVLPDLVPFLVNKLEQAELMLQTGLRASVEAQAALANMHGYRKLEAVN